MHEILQSFLEMSDLFCRMNVTIILSIKIFKGAVSYRFSQGLLTLMCNNSELKADINFFFFLLRRQTS